MGQRRPPLWLVAAVGEAASWPSCPGFPWLVSGVDLPALELEQPPVEWEVVLELQEVLGDLGSQELLRLAAGQHHES